MQGARNLVAAWVAPGPGWLPRWCRRAVTALLVLGVCGFLVDGANRPKNPYLVPAGAHRGAPAFPGMATGLLTVSSAAGTKEACMVEATTEAQQQHGLMGRTGLGGFAGMAFVFARPATVGFYMKDTLMALQVAWFDPAGRYIAAAAMPPCPPSAASCPVYYSPRRYKLAVEVPNGGLARMGIGPGASAHLGGGCTV